ncbi:hydroxyacid oxidase 1 [Paramuricea clavata]|nr:hydroxyacid oxidase 1 [Paramuricea clavata]
MANLIRRAEVNGFKAIVLTVDIPVVGKRYDGFGGMFTASYFPNVKEAFKCENLENLTPNIANTIHSSLATWDVMIPWIKSVTSLPVVLKGILVVDDAKLAVKYGADGIIVSNHGGRQFDGAPATIEVLPEIVSAVANDIEVYMDGGVRSGSDIFKALALGARAVFVGRPILWGLAYQVVQD